VPASDGGPFLTVIRNDQMMAAIAETINLESYLRGE
jgi:hypothetical protein